MAIVSNTGRSAIYSRGGVTSINNSDISNNRTGVYAYRPSVVNISQSSFSNNSKWGLQTYGDPGDLNITDSRISNNGDDGLSGGGVISGGDLVYGGGGGNVSIRNSSINNNIGDALVLGSPLSVDITNSEVSNNTGRRTIGVSFQLYSLDAPYPITIENTTISNNSSRMNGGAITVNSNTRYYIGDIGSFDVTILNSSLIGNSAALNGGAIWSDGPTFDPVPLTIINSTISDNAAGGSGGAIYLGGGSDGLTYDTALRELTLVNSTVVENTASNGGGIFTGDKSKSDLNISDSIIAGNSATVSGSEIDHQSALSFPNLDLMSGNNNVLGTSLESNVQAFNGFVPNATDITATIDGTTPTLLNDIIEPLQDNGGATQTHSLVTNSPAIDAGDLDTCLNAPVNGVDQRGETRGEAGLCDIGAYEVQGTIGGLPTINVDSIEVSEGDKRARLTVSLSSPQTERVRVDFQTVDGTATDGLDYTGRFGAMTFAPGQTQKVRFIELLDDNLGESTESFSFMLSNAVGATLDNSVGDVTIIDDDGLPTISIESADHSVNEGNSSNRRRISYTIKLSSAQTEKVSVDYQTMDQTAIGGVDYEVRSGRMTFMPGQTSKTRSINVLGDTQVESDETFKLILSNPSNNAAVGVNDADSIGTILNDD